MLLTLPPPPPPFSSLSPLFLPYIAAPFTLLAFLVCLGVVDAVLDATAIGQKSSRSCVFPITPSSCARASSPPPEEYEWTSDRNGIRSKTNSVFVGPDTHQAKKKSAALALLLFSGVCNALPSVLETISESQDLSIFNNFLLKLNETRQLDLNSVLEGGKLTVFAPTNDAFVDLYTLVGGVPMDHLMLSIMKYHIVPDVVSLPIVTPSVVVALNAQTLVVAPSEFLGNGDAGKSRANPIGNPIAASDGVVQKISGVLRPLFDLQLAAGRPFDISTIEAVQASVTELETVVSDNATALNSGWLMLCSFLVFFMQAGFAMLESGTAPMHSHRNILFKNMIDTSISSLGWWLVGYSISANYPKDQPFYGSGNLVSSDQTKWAEFLFGWGFCSTTSTIDSGATIGRIKLPVYIFMNVISGWILYPFFSHWAWNGGFLYARGFIDFAGSGVIHITGGCCGLMATILLGPRSGRWTVKDDGTKVENFQGSSIGLVVLGMFILNFGWFAFNCGSSLALTGGKWEVAATAGVNTFLSSTAGAIVMLIFDVLRTGTYSVENVCNATIASLIAITAGCGTSSPGGALILGSISAFTYFGASNLLIKLNIDDPVDVFAVHGISGMLGVIAVPFFMVQERVERAGYIYLGFWDQLAVQLFGFVVFTATASLSMFSFLFILKKIWGIRVSEREEKVGLDFIYHGTGRTLQEKIKEANKQMEREREMRMFQEDEERNKQNKNHARIKDLKKDLELAVDAEDFKNAAKIKSKIRSLEKHHPKAESNKNMATASGRPTTTEISEHSSSNGESATSQDKLSSKHGSNGNPSTKKSDS